MDKVGNEGSDLNDDLVNFAAQKLKAQSDELLAEFTEMLESEVGDLEDMSLKSYKLMRIFEQDTEEFGDQLQANLKNLQEFQDQFDKVQLNFNEIEKLNVKSKQMKTLIQTIVGKYDRRLHRMTHIHGKRQLQADAKKKSEAAMAAHMKMRR